MAETDFKLGFPVWDSASYEAVYTSYFGAPVLIRTTLLQPSIPQGTPVVVSTALLIQDVSQGTPVEVSSSGLVTSSTSRLINYWGYRTSQHSVGGFGRAQGRLKG
jgi:hypothetical protein